MTPIRIFAAAAALTFASLATAVSADAPTASAGQPLAVLLDQPTGATFVYLPEEGWKFSGRHASGQDADAAPPRAGQPVSLFVDGPTGFVYTYAVEQGWKFAGRVGDVK